MGFKGDVLLLLVLCASSAGSEQLKTVHNPWTGKQDYITRLSSTTLPTGSSNYVQTNPASQQTTAFNTSSGTVANLNTNQIQFQVSGSLIKYKDGNVIFSIPGTQETFLGYNTNLINNGGVFNTAFGATAMPYPNTGNFNNCIGNSCMSGNLLTSENNNGMGYAALGNLRGGIYNNGVGGSSLNLLTDGSANTAVGAYALNRDTLGSENTGIGKRALFWTTGNDNIGIGVEAGTSSDTVNASTNGDHNIFIGTETGQDLVADLTNAGAFGWRAYAHRSNTLQLGGQPGSGHEWEVMAASITAQAGWVSFTPKTIAELGAMTPTAPYQCYGCSNCVNDTVACSTGATRGGFGRATAKGTFPN